VNLADLYSNAGLMTLQGGTLLSTHVGDDLQWMGFQEGLNPPAQSIAAKTQHPVFSPSLQLVGLGVLVVAIMYMDHRIKIPVRL
jgi:hypothetical protein